MDKVVALVPARAGSTRVINKNIKQVKGIPLIGLAVKQANSVKSIDRVFVSTDSELYAEIARNYGAIVPFYRPAEYAQNYSTDYDVFLHFLLWYKEKNGYIPELLVQIRPTAPLRDAETIERAIQFMLEHEEFDSLRSVSLPHQSPYKMWKYNDDYSLSPLLDTEGALFDKSTQELPVCYEQDGIVDVIRSKTILEKKNMSGDRIAGFIDHPVTWDIDTEKDLLIVGNALLDKKLFEFPMHTDAIGGNIGIIQGRLTKANTLQCFPTMEWKEEFALARKCGYSAIECFRDKLYNSNNPLWGNMEDVQEIKKISFDEGVGVRSICDDYVMQCGWENLSTEQLINLIDLVIKASKLDVCYVIYPMFESAELNTIEAGDKFIKYLGIISRIAKQSNISIALEFSRDVEWLNAFFEKVNLENVGLCIDTGNLYAANISALDVIRNFKYKNKIFHIHLKDRDNQKNNVVLGKGEVNFREILLSLVKEKYEGTMVIESDRGADPVDSAINNLYFIKSLYSDVDK